MTKQNEKDAKRVPELRFKGFTDDWEQRKLGEEFQHINERNDGSFDNTRYISVANMYFKDPNEVQSNNILTRTYVMRRDDIAFEGHPSKKYKFGRFVANDIGDGVVSELFPVYRHVSKYDAKYWKYAIQIESIMAPLFAKSITSSGNSSNKLNPKHFLRQMVNVPDLNEQIKIGEFLSKFDAIITLHEEKYRQLERLKKALLQKMFADETGYPALRFKGFTEKWEHHKFKDVLKTHSFRQYLAEPQDNGNFEVIQQGDTPIIGYANGKPFTNYKEITLFGDHTLSLYKPIGPFFVATDGVKILSADGFDGQYLFATLERYKPKPQGYKRHFTILKNQNMWFTRGNYEQKKIGEFFTNFDTLITLHQHKIDNLKCLKRALLQKMFV